MIGFQGLNVSGFLLRRPQWPPITNTHIPHIHPPQHTPPGSIGMISNRIIVV